MELPFTFIIGAGLLAILTIYRFILQPVFLSPLSKIPTAHWSASFCSLWAQYYRVTHRITFKVHEAHQKYGPIIRLAPNEISVNCIEGGLRTIYAGGYEKGDWYSNVFNNYNTAPMFCMEDHSTHSRRKRMISNVYAKSTLQSSSTVAAISRIVLEGRLLTRLQAYAASGETFDMYDVLAATTLDMVSAYVVGLKNGSALLEDPKFTAQFVRGFKFDQYYYVWPQDLPLFTSFLSKIGLRRLIVPSTYVTVNRSIEDWMLEMCDNAEKTVVTINDGTFDSTHPENYPTVYAQLRAGMLKSMDKADSNDISPLRHELASELVDHTIAGFDTSSITLTWLTWQLSQPVNEDWQRKLQAEISAHKEHDPKSLDALPVLDAVLMESLRLHAAIPGNQPRVTPANATLGPPGSEFAGLPAGVRVQAQAWSLHRNPEIFPEPDTWRPSRWLDASEEQRREMMRWFWAFGSGGRMCIGSNLAMLEMKAIIALIWGHFTTSIEFDEGMIPHGGYQAEPLGKDGRYLEIKLKTL